MRADTPSADAVRALRRGDFYASTRIVLKDLQVSPTDYRLEITSLVIAATSAEEVRCCP